jgi:methyl-accepting chemotaxis protein
MTKLKNIKIGTRLTGGFCIYILITIILCVLGIMSLRTIDKELMSDSSVNTWLILSMIAAMWIATGVAISLLLSGSITGPISRLNAVHHLLANGDLTINIRVNREDELGKDMVEIKGLIERWRDLIGNVKSVAATISSAGSQLSTSAEQMSHGSNTQTERTSQVAASSEEMSQTIMEIARNTGKIAESASKTVKVAKSGQEIVVGSVEEVKKIAETVDET